MSGATARLLGVRDEDGLLGDMLAAKETCDRLGLTYPPELREYFAGADMDLKVEDLKAAMLEVPLLPPLDGDSGATTLLNGFHRLDILSMSVGFSYGEDDIRKWALLPVDNLPPDVKYIKLVMEW